MLKRNVTLAYGYIAGGSGKGRSWHEAGVRDQRPTGTAHMAAVGKALVTKGLARPGAVTARSFSMGGLHAGMASVRYSDVFAGVVVHMGIADPTVSADRFMRRSRCGRVLRPSRPPTF
ncbi:prolyl oligopeptidase family serine peptidase [Trinickia sp. LjRoot230]|uniref:prolyl oligopeptidase family serine peptidase n=1 Tax=Trinickia sp. LjRoot230 TaxID=3342288 RepID=UPI003ECE32C1